MMTQYTNSHERRRGTSSLETIFLTSRNVLQCLILAMYPLLVHGQFFFCTHLVNETWAGLVQAINDSYKLAVLCPFQISGDGCPSIDQYPQGLILGRGADDVMIIECDPDLNNPIGRGKIKSRCIIDCPGRHFTVGSSPHGLILTNMILSGATNSSIYVEPNGRLDVVNSVFENNFAGDKNGGAIEAYYGSSVSIEFSVLKNNHALLGGAIYVQGGVVNVKQSTFSGNIAIAGGGAMAIDFESEIDIEDTTFEENYAPHGGAISVDELSDLTILQSQFVANVASLYGGAIYNEGNLAVHESKFQSNFATQGGGAVNCGIGSTTTLLRNTFIKNGSNGLGPAVNDRYNSGVTSQANEGCGNTVVFMDDLNFTSTLPCNGVYFFVGLRKIGRCQPFENQCVVPTNMPSISPSILPSFIPTSMPSTDQPTFDPTFRPSVLATIIQSDYPSLQPSVSESSAPSPISTFLPSATEDSVRPTSSPTVRVNQMKSSEPSFLPSDVPSLIPSDAPSLVPSVAPFMLSL